MRAKIIYITSLILLGAALTLILKETSQSLLVFGYLRSAGGVL